MSDNVDVAIIGAGFSGLSAAVAIKAAGHKFCIFEARDRAGGRVKAGTIAGESIDLGGMWIGTTQRRLKALADAQARTTYPTWLEGESVIELLGRRVRCPREDFEPALPLLTKLEYLWIERRIARMVAAIPVEDPAAAAQAEEWDRQSLGEWIRHHVRTRGLRLLLLLVTRSVFCAEPDDLSLLHFLFYLRSAGGLAPLIATEVGGAQHLAVAGGMHQIATGLAGDLANDIKYQTPVLAIARSAEGVSIVTAEGRCDARRVIVAMAPPLVARIRFDPPLPHARDALNQRMPMGSVIKVWIAYPTPFWRRAGLNGFVSSDIAGFSPCFDVTPPGDGPGLIVGFFDAIEATHWSARPAEARKREVLGLLARTLGSSALDPLDYVENDWTTDAWSHGCYGAYAPPGVWTRFGAALRAPIGCIHWAGTETATELSGYIEGAIQAGERAAAEVVAALA